MKNDPISINQSTAYQFLRSNKDNRDSGLASNSWRVFRVGDTYFIFQFQSFFKCSEIAATHLHDFTQSRSVSFHEERDSLSAATSSASSADSVDVGGGSLREIVIYDELHALEIDPSSHQLRADENPYFTESKTFHDRVTF